MHGVLIVVSKYKPCSMPYAHTLGVIMGPNVPSCGELSLEPIRHIE